MCVFDKDRAQFRQALCVSSVILRHVRWMRYSNTCAMSGVVWCVCDLSVNSRDSHPLELRDVICGVCAAWMQPFRRSHCEEESASATVGFHSYCHCGGDSCARRLMKSSHTLVEARQARPPVRSLPAPELCKLNVHCGRLLPLENIHSLTNSESPPERCSRAQPSVGRLSALLADHGSSSPGVSLSPLPVWHEGINRVRMERLTVLRILPIHNRRGERRQIRGKRYSWPGRITVARRESRHPIPASPGACGGAGPICLQGEQEQVKENTRARH